MTRIGYVTTDLEPLDERDPDEELLRKALAGHGVDLAAGRWRDSEIDWSSCDLVVIGSPWDYHLHLEGFLEWLSRVEQLAPVANPAPVIRWNLDKAYLGVLAGRGVAVVPTRYCSSLDELVAALDAAGSSDVVVKPTVSAGSRDTGLFAARDEAARALGASVIGRGAVVMVQPAIESVAIEGEIAAVCFGGEPSHWISKGPILRHGGGFHGDRYTEHIAPTDPPPGAVATAAQALAAIDGVLGELGLGTAPAYARLDLVRLGDGSHALLEAELFEPSLFLDHAPGSADRLAAVLLGLLG